MQCNESCVARIGECIGTYCWGWYNPHGFKTIHSTHSWKQCLRTLGTASYAHIYWPPKVIMAVFKPRIPYASIAIPLANTHNSLVIPLTNIHGHTIAPHQQSLATTGTHGHTIDTIQLTHLTVTMIILMMMIASLNKTSSLCYHKTSPQILSLV